MASANGWTSAGRGLLPETNAERAKKANRNAKGKTIAAEIAAALGKQAADVNVYLHSSDAVVVLNPDRLETRLKYTYSTGEVIPLSGYPGPDTKQKIKEVLDKHQPLVGGKRKTRKQKRKVRKTKKRSQH